MSLVHLLLVLLLLMLVHLLLVHISCCYWCCSPTVGSSIVCSHLGVLLASSLDIPCRGLTTAKETVYEMLAKTKMCLKESWDSDWPCRLQDNQVFMKKNDKPLGWFWLLWGRLPAKLVCSGTGGKKWKLKILFFSLGTRKYRLQGYILKRL